MNIIYLVHAPELSRVKLGLSTRSNLRRRFGQLLVNAACALDLLAYAPGNAETEARLHSRFADRRVWREWFCDSILMDVGALAEWSPINDPRELRTTGVRFWPEWRAQFLNTYCLHRSMAQAAAEVGISHATACWRAQADKGFLAELVALGYRPRPGAWHDAFLEAYAATGSIKLASEAAGVGDSAHYYHLTSNATFRQRFEAIRASLRSGAVVVASNSGT